jgi:hypothetical protein
MRVQHRARNRDCRLTQTEFAGSYPGVAAFLPRFKAIRRIGESAKLLIHPSDGWWCSYPEKFFKAMAGHFFSDQR